MKRIVKCATQDDMYAAVDSAVTSEMIDMMKNICNQLDVDFKDIGWNIMRKKEFRQFKDTLCESLEEYLYQHDMK